VIIVDTALEERVRQGNPIRVGIVGAGFSGRTIAYQMVTGTPGLRVVAISNRTLAHAEGAYRAAGAADVTIVDSVPAIDRAIRQGQPAISDDPSILCQADGIDAVIEATGTVEFGARVALDAIHNGKDVVLANAELDATVGPILKAHADRAGVVITNTGGDEPGVAMDLIRFVRSIGLRPVVAGNLKGLYDPYRTPETQKDFAERNNQKVKGVTSFADGTKLSMELAVLANATGFGVGRRGMYGPALTHVREGADFYHDKLRDGGMVDFLVGAEPGNGAFVIGHSEDSVRKDYLKYLKMGDGPLYVFHTPFHLPQLEIPNTVARAVLFRDATVMPSGAPVCDAVTVAKRDVKAGEVLDGLGGFTCYALLENYATSREIDALPMGVSDGCRLKCDVSRDQVVTYNDVEVPAGRLCDALRAEQDALVDSDCTPRANA
jgi:predicted homoserine dehydrogenase-like protein